MKRLLAALFAVGLAVPVVADGTVTCTATQQSPGIQFSAAEQSTAAGLSCDRPSVSADGPFGNHASLTDGLVSLWKIDEASAGALVTRADSVGAENLTDQNGVPSGTGKFGNAASFTSSQSLRLYNSTDILPAGTGDFSIAIWTKQAGNVYEPTFWNGLDVGDVEYVTIYMRPESGGSAGFWVYDGTTYTSGTVLTGTTDQWWLLVGVYNSTEKKAYISVNGGTLTNSVGPNAGVRSTGATLSELGYSDVATTYADNLQDQFVVWSRALDATDISELWNGGTGTAYSGFSGALATGITHAYTLDESSLGNPSRSDELAVNTITGSVPSAAGIDGNAADFTATSSHVLSKAPPASMGHTDFSFNVWVYFKDNGNDDWFAMNGTNDGALTNKIFALFRNSPGLGIVGNRVGVVMGNGSTQKFFGTAGAVSSGAWHMVTLTHDTGSDTLSLYIDAGTPATTATGASYPVSSPASQSFKLGSGLGFFSDVYIDETGYWSRVLTTQEISDLYNSGAGLFY